MTCEWQTKLEQYVDAELPNDELAALETHLRECQNCAADALSQARLKRMTRLAASNAYSSSPEFRRKVIAQMKANPRKRWVWWPQVAVVAACIILGVGIVALWSQRSAARQRAVAELADVHLATLASANPVDVVSTDRHTVKPWFAGKLPFTFNVPELQNTPFKLVGGRVCYIEQTPAAQLLFDVGRHHVSVFIVQSRGPFARLASGALTTRGGFNVDAWRERDLQFVAISDAETGALSQLAILFRSASEQHSSATEPR